MSYSQYLNLYAEPEARVLSAWLRDHPDALPRGRTLVEIPLCREAELVAGLVASLESAASVHPAIVIFTVNQRADVSSEVKDDNERTLSWLKSLIAGSQRTIDKTMLCGPVSDRLFLFLVDRCAPGQELPARQGVGMARKIGCDIAAVMVHQEGVAADQFIRNTDGDARVGRDFFQPIIRPQLSAALFPFRHEAKQDGMDAVLSYEQYLHYYVRGLRFAGSDYAFHTVGSTIACNVTSYVSCRGFPKREAGEDFYLLNKLAKVGAVEELVREPLTLVARDSDRVPFGTGASCKKIEGLLMSGGEYRVYHPDCFRLLKHWLSAAKSAVRGTDAGAAWDQFTSEATRQFPALAPAQLQELDTTLQLRTGLSDVLKRSPEPGKRTGHLHVWFDGFRTMRFLNIARDRLFGDVSVSVAAKEF